jgi:hypothetical protein
LQDEYQDHTLPAVSIAFKSPWDFSPFGFQAEIQRENDIELTALYAKYIRKDRTSISPKDFQHALFCLAGLMKAELVPFVLEDQNNPKYFLSYGVTPPELPKLLKPRRTSLDGQSIVLSHDLKDSKSCSMAATSAGQIQLHG